MALSEALEVSSSTDELHRLFPLEEVRRRLGGIGKSTLFELLRSGRLASVKVGARRFVSGAQLAAFISTLEQEASW